MFARRVSILLLGISSIALSVGAVAAWAADYRHAGQIQGIPASFVVDLYEDVGKRALNRRSIDDSSFASGTRRTFGGNQVAYLGDNLPLAGDFNGDGLDDVGVKWTGGPHEGKWTVSYNNGNGNFNTGSTVSIGGGQTAYIGENLPIVGDFNGDGFDDIGVKWTGGSHEGKWTVSYNDGNGNFNTGSTVTVGGASKSYIGDNVPIVGDFNGDGFDDIGVKWTGGSHEGKWTVSYNNGNGNFNTGSTVSIGKSATAYIGDNLPIVGDFNGDGFDDVGVKWVGGDHEGIWGVSLNDGTGNFGAGTLATFPGLRRAYVGDNLPLVGDFNGDGFDDAGVKWTDGADEGNWVFSDNRHGAHFGKPARVTIRMPLLFLSFPDKEVITAQDADALEREVEAYFESTTGDRLRFDFRSRRFDMPRKLHWTGLPQPDYGVDGALRNGNVFPEARDYTGYECRMTLQQTQAIVGDFNGDGFDDIGVRWYRGTDRGKWFVSMNDGNGNFGHGQERSFSGANKAYRGENLPLVGDFNGDGFDDVGVKWVGGRRDGMWVFSMNDGAGNFGTGSAVSIGGAATGYMGENLPIVGDFNGDGFDDIGVKWTGGSHEGKWTVSHNDGNGNFNTGSTVNVGGAAKSYRGDNLPIVGDFNGDGFDDIGVKWTGGSHEGKWTVSYNDGNGSFNTGSTANVGGAAKSYRGANQALVGDFNGDGFDDLGAYWISGEHVGKWVVSVNDKTGAFGVGRVTTVGGGDRAYKPELGPIFHDLDGNMDWPQSNSNVHRNYCQVAERNFAGDALRAWFAADPDDYKETISWASDDAVHGPVIAYLGRGLAGGGNRMFESAWKAHNWPLKVGGTEYTEYLYQGFGPAVLAHELGHVAGLYDLYYNEPGDQCAAKKDAEDYYGFLGNYDLMAYSGDFPSFNAVNRWRMELSKARYIGPGSNVSLVIPAAHDATSPEDAIVVIQPDPSGHPTELFVLENRRPITSASGSASWTFNRVAPQGLYIYRVNAVHSRTASAGAPVQALVHDPSLCPGQLRPHQGAFDFSSTPSSAFRDGNDSGLSIGAPQVVAGGDAISLTIQVD